jgi:hypothetical protein
MMTAYTISSDDDVWSAIETLLAFDEDTPEEDLPTFSFEGWPVLNLRSAKGHAEIDALMMKGFIKYQEAVWRTFLTHSEGTRNLQHIDHDDKRQLLLPVRLATGSSKFNIDFTDVLAKIGKNLVDKLTPRDLLILVLGIGVVFTAGSIWRTHISENAKIRVEKVRSDDTRAMLETFVDLSQQDTKRLEIMARVFAAVPETRQSEIEASPARQDLLRSLPEDFDLSIDEIDLPSEVLKEIIKPERTPYEDVTLKRTYYIERASSAANGFQVRLVDAETQERFSASFGEALTSVRERTMVEQAFFQKKPIILTLDARTRGEMVMTAEIKKAESIKP